MTFKEIRKRCKFRKIHRERPTSSSLRLDERCTLKGRCSPDNCIFMMDAGGKEDDQNADRKKIKKNH